MAATVGLFLADFQSAVGAGGGAAAGADEGARVGVVARAAG